MTDDILANPDFRMRLRLSDAERRRILLRDTLAWAIVALIHFIFFLVLVISLQQAHDRIGRRSAMEKLASFLAEWADAAPDHRRFTLAMTRQDIADYLGLTIETVSRTFTQLEKDAVISIPTPREIRLTDPAALRRLNA